MIERFLIVVVACCRHLHPERLPSLVPYCSGEMEVSFVLAGVLRKKKQTKETKNSLLSRDKSAGYEDEDEDEVSREVNLGRDIHQKRNESATIVNAKIVS